MLGTRVLTALVLLALLLPALSAPMAWPFALLTLLLVSAAAWEWGRLNQAGFALSVAFGLLLAAAGAAAMGAGWTGPVGAGAPWWLVAALWVVGACLWLGAGVAAWARLARGARWAIGLLLLAAAWLAMAQARALGLNFLLSVFALVWVADIAAYAGGRAFGRHKLAPSISPGKTWEGAFSGALGVLLLALGWTALDQRFGVDSLSLYSRLFGQLGSLGALLALAVLAAMSVVGDLVESLVKRAAGAKDSSRLLPGHGGVLDRVDALLPVFPLALALAQLGR